MPFTYVLGYLLAVWLSILLHEFGHCFGARHVGGSATEILLWPLGGLAYCSAPETRRAQLITVGAGPAVTVALTGIFYAAEGTIERTFPFSAGAMFWSAVCHSLFRFNLVGALLNLLPAYPLDGGRIFLWLLEPRLGLHRASFWAARIGKVMAVAIALGGTWYFQSGLSVVLGVWLWMGCEALEREIGTSRPTLRSARIGKVVAVLIGLAGLFYFRDLFMPLLGVVLWMECSKTERAVAAGLGEESWDTGGVHYRDIVADRAEPPRPTRRRRSLWSRFKNWLRRRRPSPPPPPETPPVDESLRRRVDQLLDKVSTSGMASLTPDERDFLMTASKRFRSGDDLP
ncbi:MAG: hypothetical protein HZA54_05700 [Planctomycetes bacterium]|nr:hypothetical protein [Planctomycetota bacterium]